MGERVILTLDVEEFDVPLEYGQALAPDTQLAVGREGLASVLDLLAEFDIRTTCFTTANFALHSPAQMQRLAQGHEIASHGYWHSQFDVADLAQSRHVLRELSGQEVLGFRMARMAAVEHAAIAQAGYLYNSSDNPIWLPGRYNHFRQPRLLYWSGPLLNIPVTASPVLRVPLFWLAVKNFPWWFLKLTSRRTLGHDGIINLYFHPWEFAELGAYRLPWIIRRRHGAAMRERLRRYLGWLQQRATFITMGEYAQELRARRRI